MAPRKVQFMQQVQAAATQLAQALEAGNSLAKVYRNREYGLDGSDPIASEDLAGHEVEPLEIAQFVTFITALNDIGAVIPDLLGYDALLDKLRTDR